MADSSEDSMDRIGSGEVLYLSHLFLNPEGPAMGRAEIVKTSISTPVEASARSSVGNDSGLVAKDRTAPCNGTSNLKYTDET